MANAAVAPQRAKRTPMTAPAIPEPVVAEPAPEVAVMPSPLANGAARKPFGTRQQRLENTPIPGFQCYWFNDTPGRIERALEAGYSHVTVDGRPNGIPVKKIVGTASGGGPLHAYRMKLPIEFHLQDMEAKEAPRAQFDKDQRIGVKEMQYTEEGRPGFNSQAVTSANIDRFTGRQKFNPAPPGGEKPQS